MATDKSQPRVGLIFKIGLFTIATLVVVHAGLVAYFDDVARAEEYRKVGDVKPESLINMRADERQRLSSGAMPIDKAMQQLASRGRQQASPEIMPSASKDLAPLQGWSKMPAEVPPAMTAPEPAPVLSAADAGLAAPADGGAQTGNKPERGRPDGGPAAKLPAKQP